MYVLNVKKRYVLLYLLHKNEKNINDETTVSPTVKTQSSVVGLPDINTKQILTVLVVREVLPSGLDITLFSPAFSSTPRDRVNTS